jgi:putative endonuclease
VFVEVRTRTSQQYGTPEESVTARKRAKLVACALDYIATHDRYRDSAWRIDVVGIEIDEEGRQLRADITESAVPVD